MNIIDERLKPITFKFVSYELRQFFLVCFLYLLSIINHEILIHCPLSCFAVCLQQQKISQLLSLKERDGKGYIPQCDENGEFITRQCSRNGKVCWCVDGNGRNLPQSIGAAESVNCSFVHKQRGKGIMFFLSSQLTHYDVMSC